MSIATILNRLSWLSVVVALLLVVLPWQTRWLGAMVVANSEFGRWSVYATELLVLIVWVLLCWRQRQWLWPWESTRKKVIVVCVVFVITSVAVSTMPVASAAALFHVIIGVMLVAILRQGPLSASAAMVWFVGGVAIAVAIGWMQWITQTVSGGSWVGMASQASWQPGVVVIDAGGRWLRAYATWPHPNIFGVYAAVASVMAVQLWVWSRQRWWLVVMLWCVSGVCLSFSRAAAVGLVVGLVVWVVATRRDRKLIAQGAVTIIFAGVVLMAMWWPVVSQRAQTSDNHLEVQSVQERSSGYQLARELVARYWWQGSGLGTYVIVAQQVAPATWPQPVHNVWVMFLVELGVGGVVILLLFIRGVVCWARRSSEPALWLAMGMLLLVVSLIDHWLWSLYPGLALVALVAGFIGRSAVEVQKSSA